MDLLIHQEHNKDSDLIDHPLKKPHRNYEYGHNHDRHLIWHLNNISHERYIMILAQIHSPEVYCSLFIMVAVMVMLERVEMQPGMAPAAVPSPIFAGSAFVLCILCISAASSREHLRRSLYSQF